MKAERKRAVARKRSNRSEEHPPSDERRTVLLAYAPAAKASEPKPGERLWTMTNGRSTCWAELRAHAGFGFCELQVLAAAINSTVVAGENPTVGSAVWLPAESVAPGR